MKKSELYTEHLLENLRSAWRHVLHGFAPKVFPLKEVKISSKYEPAIIKNNKDKTIN